ncbi:MAG: hypothetical protein WD690_13425 [Vicinamibacterales bacterium]
MVFLILAAQAAGPALPDVFRVHPMVTSREDVLKILGAPAQMTGTWITDRPGFGDIAKILIEFDERDVTRRVDLHFAYPIARESVVARYRLTGAVARTTIDGRRVEYFRQAMLSLNYAGALEQAGVASMTRYHPHFFREFVQKHPHVRETVAQDSRILGTVLTSYAVDATTDQCELDCWATRTCRGFTVALRGQAGPTCSLMSEIKEVVPAPGHYSVHYW